MKEETQEKPKKKSRFYLGLSIVLVCIIVICYIFYITAIHKDRNTDTCNVIKDDKCVVNPQEELNTNVNIVVEGDTDKVTASAPVIINVT